jgi:predicted GNAT family acetyltransferase
MTISHNEPDSRFECRVEGGLAFAEYHRNGDRITFTHTEVPPKAAGRGVAAEIVAAGLAYAREQQLQVVPECAYVKSYLQLHREWEDVVDPEFR